MASVSATSANAAYRDYRATSAYTATPTSATTTAALPLDQPAAEITLSEEARAVLAEPDLPTLRAETRSALNTLLTDAQRSSPLKDGKLALDISSLSQRALYLISTDESFSADERAAATIERKNRLASALSGPATIAELTENYASVYKAAAAYLDAMGTEERDTAAWKNARAAVTKAQTALAQFPKEKPDGGEHDPVKAFMSQSEPEKKPDTASPELATGARALIDRLYKEAEANGKIPTFNRNTTIGQFIDLSGLSSRTLSLIVTDKTSQFSADEVSAARKIITSRSGATLLASFKAAGQSNDPSAFSQNIISAYASLSTEERQAAGWSENLYRAALQNYASTQKLLGVLNQTAGSTPTGTPAAFSWLWRS